jgi:hypothetical protein
MGVGFTTSSSTSSPAIQMVSKIGANPQSAFVLVKQSPARTRGSTASSSGVAGGATTGGTIVIGVSDPHRGEATGPTNDDYGTVACAASTGAQLWVQRYKGPANAPDMATALVISPDGTLATAAPRAARSNGRELHLCGLSSVFTSRPARRYLSIQCGGSGWPGMDVRAWLHPGEGELADGLKQRSPPFSPPRPQPM